MDGKVKLESIDGRPLKRSRKDEVNSEREEGEIDSDQSREIHYAPNTTNMESNSTECAMHYKLFENEFDDSINNIIVGNDEIRSRCYHIFNALSKELFNADLISIVRSSIPNGDSLLEDSFKIESSDSCYKGILSIKHLFPPAFLYLTITKFDKSKLNAWICALKRIENQQLVSTNKSPSKNVIIDKSKVISSGRSEDLIQLYGSLFGTPISSIVKKVVNNKMTTLYDKEEEKGMKKESGDTCNTVPIVPNMMIESSNISNNTATTTTPSIILSDGKTFDEKHGGFLKGFIRKFHLNSALLTPKTLLERSTILCKRIDNNLFGDRLLSLLHHQFVKDNMIVNEESIRDTNSDHSLYILRILDKLYLFPDGFVMLLLYQKTNDLVDGLIDKVRPILPYMIELLTNYWRFNASWTQDPQLNMYKHEKFIVLKGYHEEHINSYRQYFPFITSEVEAEVILKEKNRWWSLNRAYMKRKTKPNELINKDVKNGNKKEVVVNKNMRKRKVLLRIKVNEEEKKKKYKIQQVKECEKGKMNMNIPPPSNPSLVVQKKQLTKTKSNDYNDNEKLCEVVKEMSFKEENMGHYLLMNTNPSIIDTCTFLFDRTFGVVTVGLNIIDHLKWEKKRNNKIVELSKKVKEYGKSHVQKPVDLRKKYDRKNKINEMAGDILLTQGICLYTSGSSNSNLSSSSSNLDITLTSLRDHSPDLLYSLLLPTLEVLYKDGSRMSIVSRDVVEIFYLEEDEYYPISFHFSKRTIYFSLLMTLYDRCDDRVSSLCLYLKHWASKTFTPEDGVSSYVLTTLLIHFLQSGIFPPVLPSLNTLHKARSIPNEMGSIDIDSPFVPTLPVRINNQTLGSLLIHFFLYYSNFPFDQFIISIRKGGIIQRSTIEGNLPDVVLEDPFDKSFHIYKPINLTVFKKKVQEGLCKLITVFDLFD